MNWTTTRAITATLLLGAVMTIASTVTLTAPAHAAAATTFKIPADNKPLADAFNGALADAKAGRYPEAIAKAKQADGMPGKPAGMAPQLHQLIFA